jgi:DsbC/DsbD-like thiol-disulfide interchange protein
MNRRSLILSSLALALASSARAGAGKRYDVKLIGGAMDARGLLVGVSIVMEPGWKTYWRMPGEAGIPPSFDWSGSSNIANVEILYPAPRRYADASGETVGYQDSVVFPLILTRKDEAKPAQLVADMFFAVCKDICIPAKAKPSLTLGMSSPKPADMALIKEALAAIPKPATDPVFQSAHLVEQEGRLVLALREASPTPEPIDDIFVESETSAYFRKPHSVDGAYHLAIDGIKEAAKLQGKPLKLTILHGTGPLEQLLTVD